MRQAACLLLALLWAAPAAGDWLVLRDGSRVETEGAWKVKGRQVVFSRVGGSLAALRTADVDLEASEAATAESQKPPPAATETEGTTGRRKSVRVWTDKDIPRAAVAPSSEGEGEAEVEEDASEEGASEEGASEGEAKEESSSAAADPVVLQSWESRDSADVDGLEIYGSVRNTGDSIAAGVMIQVSVADEEGNPLADTRAFLKQGSLSAGQTSTFRALLPGIYTLLADPTFEITSDGFTIQGPNRDDEDSEEDPEGAEELEVAANEG